jgi:periplasmic protein TonB
MKKHIFLLFFFIFSFVQTFAQQEDSVVVNYSKEVPEIEKPLFIYPQIPPKFPGGTDALGKFIQKNLHYNEEPFWEGIEGKVIVGFVIHENGVISDINIIKSLHPLLDKSSVLMIQSMPKWEPGIIEGKPVAVYHQLPVKFKIIRKKPEDYNKKKK